MDFGELVIPSSRSLWDEDYNELTEYQPAPIKWTSNSELPTEIDTLFVVDSKPIIEVFRKCVVNKLHLFMKAPENGVFFYDLKNNNYLLMYEVNPICPSITTGEIITNLTNLVNDAKKVYGITSLPVNKFQGEELDEEKCTIYSLSTDEIYGCYKRLPIPNVITGICANLLNYRLCIKKPCTTFIGYLDNDLLDSVNTKDLLQLIENLGIKNVDRYCLKLQTPSNNLYM